MYIQRSLWNVSSRDKLAWLLAILPVFRGSIDILVVPPKSTSWTPIIARVQSSASPVCVQGVCGLIIVYGIAPQFNFASRDIAYTEWKQNGTNHLFLLATYYVCIPECHTRKTKVMRLNTNIKDPIKMYDQDIEDAETFTYLGGIATPAGGCDEDITNRLGKAKGQFRRLKNIWSSSKLSILTKVRLFNSLVMSVLTYGSETWKTTERDKKKLYTFQNRCLRQ